MSVCFVCRRVHPEEKTVGVMVPGTQLKLFICYECLGKGVCGCGKKAEIWIFGKGFCGPCAPATPPC